MLDNFDERLHKLMKEKEDYQKLLSDFPDGRLEIYESRGYARWYLIDNNTRTYLPKAKKEIANVFAQKHQYESMLKRTEDEILFLSEIKKRKEKIDDKSRLIYDNKYIKLLKDAPYPGNVHEYTKAALWLSEPFVSNPAHPEKLIHESPSGHLLRSKAEAMIDRELFLRNIPFRYEAKLVLNGDFVFEEYPDFTIYKETTGEVKYWEHYGMMDDPGYQKKYIKKTERYIANNILPDINLICTYETQSYPLTYSKISDVIEAIEIWLYS